MDAAEAGKVRAPPGSDEARSQALHPRRAYGIVLSS